MYAYAYANTYVSTTWVMYIETHNTDTCLCLSNADLVVQ